MVKTRPGLIVDEIMANDYLMCDNDFSVRRKAHNSHDHYITFHGYTTHEQDEELEQWLKINTTDDYFLCRDRVYFKEEADMGWFLLRWPPS